MTLELNIFHLRKKPTMHEDEDETLEGENVIEVVVEKHCDEVA